MVCISSQALSEIKRNIEQKNALHIPRFISLSLITVTNSGPGIRIAATESINNLTVIDIVRIFFDIDKSSNLTLRNFYLLVYFVNIEITIWMSHGSSAV